MTPANERKAAERQRRKDAGLVRVEVWVPPQIAQNLKTYAESLTRQYLLTLDAARNPLTNTKP